MKQIITRFAPSPTGMLHIGGARTALFNFLFAKKHGGKFLLRIEDTDKERSTEEANKAILKGMDWLKLHHNDQIVYQSNNLNRHKELVEILLKTNKAYECYEKKITNNDGTIDVIKTEKPAIKIKISQGKTSFEDSLHGKMEIDNKEIEDFVILRSDGTPTYMMAVVADDYDMEITHIIRGDDHVSNTFKQVILYDALGFIKPNFTHIPLIHDIEGKKLSKRKNAVSVEEYKEKGYLNNAVLNYLMQLGWNPKSEDEIISLEEASKVFDLKSLGKSPSRFDYDKLNNINLKYIQRENNEEFLNILHSFLTQFYQITTKELKIFNDTIIHLIPELKKQSNLRNISNLILRFIRNPIILDHTIASIKELESLFPDKNNNENSMTYTDQQILLNNKAVIDFEIIDNTVFFKDINNKKVIHVAPLLSEEGKELIKQEKEIVNELLVFLKNLPNADNFKEAFKGFLKEKNYKFGKAGPILRSLLIGIPKSVDLSLIILTIAKTGSSNIYKRANLTTKLMG